MHREHQRWHSPNLGRDMDLLVFGHGGARVLVFPTSQGRFFEWEDRGMVGALAEHLERGWVQLYCVDSVDAESWYARWKHPEDRARRQTDYEHYLLREVLPFSVQRNPNPFLVTAGASFGAYHAMDLALRHPHLVGRVLAMAGLYDIARQTGGYSEGEVYAHNPAHYVQHEGPGSRLDAWRRLDIIMAIGRDDPMRENNEWFSQALWQQGVGNALRLWDGWAHDWPWWREMVVRYIGGHD